MIRALTCGAVVSLLLGACCAPSMVAPRAWTAAAAPTSTAEAWTQLPGPVGRTGLRTLDDNAAAWAARWELVTQARATIDVGAFIFDHDVFGIALLGALLERAERGVAVRVLVDGRGSVGLSAPLFGRDSLQELVGTGRARVRVFHPVWSELLAALATLDAVPVSAGTHNKLLVVDGAQAIVGGRNVSTRSFVTLAEDPAAVRDADVVVDGADIVAALARVFDDEFAAAGDEVAPDVVNVVPQKDALVLSARLMDAWVRGEVPGGGDEGSDDEVAADADGDDAPLAAALVQHVLDGFDHAPDAPTRAFVQRQARQLVRYRSLWGAVPQRPLPSLDVTARVVTTPARLSGRAGGRGDDNDATRALLLGIGGARRRIVLQTPSFVLSPALLEALRAAGERGVDIVVVTNGPRSTDSPIPQALFIDSWPEVMARVPRLRLFVERGPFMQHAKRAVFDDDLCFIGTFNLDPFSVQMNSETIVVTSSPRLASALQTQVAAVLPEMDEYRIARNVDGRARRHPVGTPHAGEVEVEFGPRDQVGADEIASLERTKALLLAVQPMFDFDVLVW